MDLFDAAGRGGAPQCAGLASWLPPDGAAVRVIVPPGGGVHPGVLAGLDTAELSVAAAAGTGGWFDDWMEPPPPTHPLAALVHLASTRGRDALTLFGRAYRWLVEGGRLILIDDYTIRRGGHGQDGCLVLEQVIALAGRAGFRLLADRLIALPWTPPSAGVPLAGRLLVFERGGTASRWRVTYQEPERAGEARALFQRVFAQTMSPELWHWKYGGGRGQGALALRDDQVVGHYGVLTRRILFFGRAERAAQVADVMVDPADRAVLTRRGAFYQTAAALPESCSGYGSRHLIGFGFPNRRAFRVAERLGLYAEVGCLDEVHWPARHGMPPGLVVENLSGIPASRAQRLVEPLWRAMAADLREAIVGIRDWEWLRWRYLEHPCHGYQVLLARRGWGRRPFGVLVLREHPDRVELMDLVAPRARLPELVALARDRTARAGRPSLFCWITRPHVGDLGIDEATVTDPDVRIPTSIHTAGPDPAELEDRWWLMSGDTDFR